MCSYDGQSVQLALRFCYGQRGKLNHRKKLFLEFGSQFSNLFNVDISTKLHHLIHHVTDYILHHGCIRRGNSEDNEGEHKQFKSLFNNTKRHIHSIASQLLTSWVHSYDQTTNTDDCNALSDLYDSIDSNYDIEDRVQQTWT